MGLPYIENCISEGDDECDPGQVVVAISKLVEPVIVSQCRYINGRLLPYPRDSISDKEDRTKGHI